LVQDNKNSFSFFFSCPQGFFPVEKIFFFLWIWNWLEPKGVSSFEKIYVDVGEEKKRKNVFFKNNKTAKSNTTFQLDSASSTEAFRLLFQLGRTEVGWGGLGSGGWWLGGGGNQRLPGGAMARDSHR
jgi:hypothetical protein